jgi:hypothetical protein
VRAFGEDSPTSLVACVADGAGSARFSDTGATIVCNTILENAARFIGENGRFDGLQLEDILAWCEEARNRIKNEAKLRDCQTRELASTLSAAVIGPTYSFFFQIGDGAIVLGNGQVYGVVFWPQSGEYANSTNFITSDEYQKQLEFLATPSRCSEVALFTDGIDRLALRYDCQTPHTPFFQPLFRALRTTKNVDGLNEGLIQFLNSDSVQNRSDDDKTLILATRDTDGNAD